METSKKKEEGAGKHGNTHITYTFLLHTPDAHANCYTPSGQTLSQTNCIVIVQSKRLNTNSSFLKQLLIS